MLDIQLSMSNGGGDTSWFLCTMLPDVQVSWPRHSCLGGKVWLL